MHDPISERLYAKIDKQEKKGLNKYGTTISEADLTNKELINHAVEEAIDLAIYLEALLVNLEKESKQ